MDQANRQLTSVNDFFVAGIVRTRARPSLSRPQREKGGGVTQKPGLSSLHCSLLTRLRRSSGAGTGSAATNDVRSVSLSGVLSLSGNKPCETLTPGLALTPAWAPPHSDVTAINNLHQPILRSDEQYPDHWEQCLVTSRGQARTGPQTRW